LSGNKSVDVYTHLNSGFLDWKGGLLRLERYFLSKAEEEFEDFLVKLKLPIGEKMVRFLVNLKLLAEVRMCSSLVKRKLLLERG
jgi:hypothetical protein